MGSTLPDFVDLIYVLQCGLQDFSSFVVANEIKTEITDFMFFCHDFLVKSIDHCPQHTKNRKSWFCHCLKMIALYIFGMIDY